MVDLDRAGCELRAASSIEPPPVSSVRARALSRRRRLALGLSAPVAAAAIAGAALAGSFSRPAQRTGLSVAGSAPPPTTAVRCVAADLGAPRPTAAPPADRVRTPSDVGGISLAPAGPTAAPAVRAEQAWAAAQEAFSTAGGGRGHLYLGLFDSPFGAVSDGSGVRSLHGRLVWVATLTGAAVNSATSAGPTDGQPCYFATVFAVVDAGSGNLLLAG